MTAMTRAWHACATSEVARELETDPARGLSSDEARRRLAEHGPNALPEATRRSLSSLFFTQFKSPLIYLLLGAAALALATGHAGDAAVVLVVVLANAAIGAFQEGRAERSMEALRRLSALRQHVIRDGVETVVPARDLVPGDLLLLAPGDAVGADARVVEACGLEAAEAALTGESWPIHKEATPLPADTVLAERRDMVYAGTHVTSGRSRALVVATGLASEIGRIAAMTQAAEEPPTPLERRIEQLGRWAIVGALLLFALTISIGLLRGLPPGQILMVAVSQVVSMIPEGLPVAVTIALAVGVQRMAGRGVIVRRLAAVETLGSTTAILSDKTGTLTLNEMTVTAIHLPDGRELEVTGAGWDPEGEIRSALPAGDDPALGALLRAGALCNDASLQREEGRWTALGDPTEAALLVLARKGGVDPELLRRAQPRRGEVPFDAATKLMATEHAEGVVIKGAPEVVLALCGLDPAAHARLTAAAERLASRALRVLAVAGAPGATLAGGLAALSGRVTCLGLVGQLDPPRPMVRQAIADCQAAGIKTVMVTGDHKTTALAIARMLGIAREGDVALDGRALEELDDAALERELERVAVFARVHPAQKLRIVEASQRRGAVVAMTGDGVNDAPALARADVGVAMGITGTEVAKQAAKVVITDDDFGTIVRGVEEGRLVLANLKKVLLYLLSTSMAEILILLLALIAGYPIPLAAVQILWINLVTEGTVTVNLVMDGLQGDELRRPPTPRDEPLLTWSLLSRMGLMTPMIALATLTYFVHHLTRGDPFPQVQTGTFTVLAVCQWFNLLNCRSETRSALSFDLLKNRWLIGGLVLSNLLQVAVVFAPPLNRAFHTVPLPWDQVIEIGLLASSVLWVEELRKWVARRRARREEAAA